MKAKLLFVFLAAVCIISLIPAAAMGQQSQTYFQKLEGYVSTYNSSSDKIPGPVKMLFGNEKINFHIQLADGGEEIIGVAISAGGKEITEFTNEALENPTLRVYVKGSSIDGVLQNPSMNAALDLIGEMEIEGVGLLKKGKVFVLKIARTVLSWFM